MSVRRLALVAIAMALLAGCGDAGGPPADSAAPGPSASPAASETPLEEPTLEPTAAPTEEPSAEPSATLVPIATPTSTTPPGLAFESTECKEPKLDTDGVELVAVKLARTGDTITATFTDDQPVPETKDLLWSIWAVRAGEGAGPRVVQLAAEISDDEEIAHFVFAGGTQTNLSKGEGMKASGKKLTATFPAAPITDLGAGARWYASLTVEQETKDYCPGGRGIERDKITGIEFPASWFAAAPQ